MTEPPVPPPPPGGYPPPQPPPGGGYPPPQPPPGGGYPPPQPPPGGGYPPPQPPPGGGYPPPQPPPGGGYPPPQPPPGGGYPPPQPPGGGYPPPQPPPGGGYPPAGGPGYGGYDAGPQYSVGEAFSWAWNKFSKNAAALIVSTLVYAVIMGVLYGIMMGLMFALAPTVTTYSDYSSGVEYSASAGFGVASYFVGFVGVIVLFVVLAGIQSAYVSGLLDIANGQQVTIGSFFKPRNVGNVIIAGLIIGVAYAIGSLCFVGGLVVGFFTVFAIVALLDRNLAPIDAIKTSFELAKAKIGDSLLVWILSGLIAAAGLLVCGVGIIVSAPVAQLFLVYSWRRLSGGQIAPLTP